MADDDSSWKWIFTIVAIPVGLEIASELFFTFTDAGTDFLYTLSDAFNLEGGLHGADAVAHAGHNHGAVSAVSNGVAEGTCDMINGTMQCG